MSNGNQQVLNQPQENIDPITDQADVYDVEKKTNEAFNKIAVGTLVGATLGAIAGALAIKGTAEKVNQTVKNAGTTVRGAAEGFNQTVKDIGTDRKSVV